MYMLICGERRFSQDGKSITVYDPATHEEIESVPEASKEDVDSAIKYAFEGFEKWSRTLLFERINIIRKFADLIENNYETEHRTHDAYHSARNPALVVQLV